MCLILPFDRVWNKDGSTELDVRAPSFTVDFLVVSTAVPVALSKAIGSEKARNDSRENSVCVIEVGLCWNVARFA